MLQSAQEKFEDERGSNLPMKHLEYFHDRYIVSSKKVSLPNTNPFHGFIREELLKYIITMTSFSMETTTSEIDDLQEELTSQLFSNISEQYFSERFQNEIVLAKRGFDSRTRYSTILRSNVGELTKVRGECDSTLLYGDIPVACWGNRSVSNKQFFTTRPKAGTFAQAFAEIKGTSEHFQNAIGLAAPRFTGVLTSGLVWTLVIQEFYEGSHRYTDTSPIAMLSRTGTIVDGNVDIVASLLMYHLEATEVLMGMIDDHFARLKNKPISVVFDDSLGVEDEVISLLV